MRSDFGPPTEPLDTDPARLQARVRALEASLRDLEARYRLLSDHATDMIVASDRDSQTTFVSPGCYALIGWTAEEAVGRDVEGFAHREDAAALREALARTAAGEFGVQARWRCWHRVDERWVWLESNPSVLMLETGERGVVDVVRDVTAQVARDTALAEAHAAATALLGAIDAARGANRSDTTPAEA